MKKALLILFLTLSFTFRAQVTFTDSDLPIIVINTSGQTIIDTARVFVDMGIIYNGVGVRNYMINPFNHYTGKISIEIRGSTSQQYPKKSYGFETQDALGTKIDTALLGLPSENDWILYGAYPDKTLMRNEMTYDIFRRMGHYDVRYKYAELVIDGQYKGVYTFMEKIKRDKNRVAISKLTPADTLGDDLTGGYIIKIDKQTGGSNTFWPSPYNSKVKYLYHDPEDTELHITQSNYIKNYVTNFENIMNGAGFANTITGYPSVIEVNSFIDFMIMQELGRTVDGYRSSSFMYKEKDSKGGLLRAGPMWDFNLSYGNADYCDAFDTTGYQYNFNTVCPTFSSAVPFWWNKFLQDNNYKNALQCRWQYLRATVLNTDSINDRIDTMAAILLESQQRNFTEWPILGVYVNWNYYIGNTYQDELNYLKWWFKSRSEWLDANWPGTCNTVAIENGIKLPNVSWQLFPNPATEYFIMKISEPYLMKSATFQLFDVLGREVFQAKNINSNEFVVTREGLTNGVYLFKLVNGGKIIASGKVVLN